MQVKVNSKGNFNNITKFLSHSHDTILRQLCEHAGQDGVEALRMHTPKDTGLTANSWSYKVEHNARGWELSWWNDNIHGGAPVTIVLYYGYVTTAGNVVSGIDYISPALDPIVTALRHRIEKEVLPSG